MSAYNLIKFTDFLFKPFYRYNFWPLNVRFIKHPIRKQFQFSYYKYFSKFHNFDQIIELEITDNIKYKLLCNGSLCSHQLDLILAGRYENEITQLVCKELNDDSIFIDIGANIGYYSMLASSIIGKNGEVVAIEPVTEAFRRLKKNFTINSFTNHKTYQLAVGNYNEERQIYIYKKLGHSSILERDEYKEYKDLEEIRLCKADEIIKYKNKDIFIKIDTEGYEFEALKGMENTLVNNNCKIVFEFTPKFYRNISQDYFSYSLSCLTFLSNLKFELYVIEGEKLSEITDLEAFVNNAIEAQTYIYAFN